MSTLLKSTTALAAVSLGGLKVLEQFHKYSASKVSSTWNNEVYVALSENSIRVYTLGSITASRKVILVHGIGHSSVSMASMGQRIHQTTGVTVIRYDRPGYGSSRFLSPEPRSLQQFVAELDELLEKFTSDSDEVTIIGHSLGGLIARLAREDYDRREGISVIMLDPTHPREASTDRSKRLGMVLAGHELERRTLLSYFGGELLDASIGKIYGRSSVDRYENASHAERFTARSVRATRKESEAVFGLLFNGKYVNVPKKRPDIFVLASEKSNSLTGSEELLKEYSTSDNTYRTIEGTDHESMIQDPRTLQHIVTVLERGFSQ